MTDTTKATPRPWRVHPKVTFGGARVVRSAIETNVATVHTAETADADAALIVQAVNAFDAMREALRLAIRGLDTDGPASAAATLNVQGRAALAAAEGKEEAR